MLDIAVTFLTLLLAYPLALYIHGLSARRRALVLACEVLPTPANVLAVIYGLQLLLGGSRPINRYLMQRDSWTSHRCYSTT